MLHRGLLVLVLLVATACGAGGEDRADRIAELEAQVAELEAEVTQLRDALAAAEQDAEEVEDPDPDAGGSTPSATADDGGAADPDTADAEEAEEATDAEPALAEDLTEARGFETPSGNIACLAADYGRGPYLQCEIGTQLVPPPDEVCDFDWSGVTMTATGAASPLCASDTMRGELGSDPEVLAYGESWVAGPFRCVSEETGLTCTNGDGGRLFLSRASWEAS